VGLAPERGRAVAAVPCADRDADFV